MTPFPSSPLSLTPFVGDSAVEGISSADWQQTNWPCPGSSARCNHSFAARQESDGRWTVWCTVGRCPSYVANDGVTAPTLLEACQKLDDLVCKDLATLDIN